MLFILPHENCKLTVSVLLLLIYNSKVKSALMGRLAQKLHALACMYFDCGLLLAALPTCSVVLVAFTLAS